jgi:hypothetical protein
VNRANLEELAERDEGARSFRLEWLEGPGRGVPWLLLEDTLAKAAAEQASTTGRRPPGAA